MLPSMRNSHKGQIKESGNRTKAGSSHAITATASCPAAYSAAKSRDSGARTDCPRTAAKTGTGSSPFGYSRSCCGNSCRWISDSPFSGTPPKEDSLFQLYLYSGLCGCSVHDNVEQHGPYRALPDYPDLFNPLLRYEDLQLQAAEHKVQIYSGCQRNCG